MDFAIVSCDWKGCESLSVSQLRFGFSPQDNLPGDGPSTLGKYCRHHAELLRSRFPVVTEFELGHQPEGPTSAPTAQPLTGGVVG